MFTEKKYMYASFTDMLVRKDKGTTCRVHKKRYKHWMAAYGVNIYEAAPRSGVA
jgi:hypothetical protein